MDDGGPAASIFLFIILLLIDMFFYGFGSAIHCLNVKDIDKRAKENKDNKSLRLSIIMNNPTQYVNVVQVAVTLINIIMGSFYLGVWLRNIQSLIVKYIGLENLSDYLIGIRVISIASLFVTMIILVYILLTFGVWLPKKLAAKNPDKWAYLCITPIYYVTKILTPFTKLISATTSGILRLFGIKDDKDMIDVTEEEIISMVNEGHEQGVLQAVEAEMITNIFEFGDKEAQDIMTHRKNVVAVDGMMSLKDAIRFMLEANNSRFPVYDGNIDHIIGILHLRDTMRLHAENEQMNIPIKEIDGLLRAPLFIPETKNIDALFQIMQPAKTQMVIVVDEYGQTAGVLAMEDILEEIVGNIMDEYDEDEKYILATDNEDEYIIEGKTPLEELEERLDIFFDEDEFDTLNGFLISKMDKIPEENEEFEIDVNGYNFKLLSVENKMIQSVLVTKIRNTESGISLDDDTTEVKKEND